MGEVLSQSQIDALLQSMQGGGDDAGAVKAETAPEKKYQKYNFYSPKKFTKDKLRVVSNVHENYARIVSSQINSLFRVSSEMELGAVEEQRYHEFRNALSEHDTITVVAMDLQDGSKSLPALVHLSPTLVVNMIDRMLGGVGEDQDIDVDYVYSEIERELYKSILHYIVSAISDSWTNYVKLTATIQDIEENPQMMQVIGLDEIVILCVIEVRMGVIDGKITVCLPAVLMDIVFAIFDKRSNVEKEFMVEGRDTRQMIMSSIRHSGLEIKALMPEVSVSLNDIYNLQIGDVINLNQPKDAEVNLMIAGNPWFSGKIGLKNRSMAVEIADLNEVVLQAIEEKQELMNKEQDTT